MPKSEYYEPKKLPGERPYPQILNDAEELYGLLLTAETMMTKVDKIRYNNRAVDQILDVIKEFVLAYDFEDDREIHLKRMCANVTRNTEPVSATSSGRWRRTTRLRSLTGFRWTPADFTTRGL